jgi:hypothetical protein
VDLSAFNSIALIKAFEFSKPEVVRLLLEDGRAGPAANESESIRIAARSPGCSLEVVGLLLDDGRADPNANNYEAAKWACWNADTSLCNFLFVDDRFQPSMTDLKEIYLNTPIAVKP